MDEKDIDTLSEELIGEFTKLGADYPYLTKMIMDVVSIVSQQNTQLEAITSHLETLTLEVNKQHFIVEEIIEGLDGGRRSSVFSGETKFDYLPPLVGTKKEDLN